MSRCQVCAQLLLATTCCGSLGLWAAQYPRDAKAALYAVDYKHYYHRDKSRKAGFLVAERFPELMPNYHLFAGSDVSGFIEEIGGDIDLALVGTSHMHPVETLNLLAILPFMKPGSWVVRHDIGIFLKPLYNSFATKYIFDAWQDERIESEFKSESIDAANIGAIRVELLEENKRQLLSILFNRWDKDVADKDIAQTRSIIDSHYTEVDLKSFDRAVAYNRRYLAQVNSIKTNWKNLEKLLRQSGAVCSTPDGLSTTCAAIALAASRVSWARIGPSIAAPRAECQV